MSFTKIIKLADIATPKKLKDTLNTLTTDINSFIEDRGAALVGNGAPTTSTEGVVGSLYMDANSGKLYKCTAVNGNTYTWVLVEGSGSGSGGSLSASIEDNILVLKQSGTTYTVIIDNNTLILK